MFNISYNSNILVQKYSTNELKSKLVKLRLPFCHANGNILKKQNIVELIFNTNTVIDNNIIHNKLKELCKKFKINYDIVLDYIKDLELQYSKHFLCE